MEQQILELLRATLLPSAGPRQAAETQLLELYTNPQFPQALVTVGTHNGIAVADRQAALLAFGRFVDRHWSPEMEDYAGTTLVDDSAKTAIRQQLLESIYVGETQSKLTAATASVVAKIAKADFPEEWPDLMQSLLSRLSTSNSEATQGITVVLAELVESGLDEDQFLYYAQPLLAGLLAIVVDEKYPLFLRAHAVYVYRGCFDFVDALRTREEQKVEAFVQLTCSHWFPALRQLLVLPLAGVTSNNSGSEEESLWNGIIAIKTQAASTIARFQHMFPTVLPAEDLFRDTLHQIEQYRDLYLEAYIRDDQQSMLLTQYNIPYTLDNLAIEYIKLLQEMMEAPALRATIQQTRNSGQSVGPWLVNLFTSILPYAQLSLEQQSQWESDINMFLNTESAEAENSPRQECASVAWKVCEWFPNETMQALGELQNIKYSDPYPNWQEQEAVLYLLQQLSEDVESDEQTVDGTLVQQCAERARTTLLSPEDCLRARSFVVIAALSAVWAASGGADTHWLTENARVTLNAMKSDTSDIVKTACLRIVRDYMTTLPPEVTRNMQTEIVDEIAKFLSAQDMSDLDANIDLIDAALQTLRDTILADAKTCLTYNGLDTLMSIVKMGAARDSNTSAMINETFSVVAEELSRTGDDTFQRLCMKMLPDIVESIDRHDPSDFQLASMTDVVVSTLSVLTEAPPRPLPVEFISPILPRIVRLILNYQVDAFVSLTATEGLKNMVANNSKAVFEFVDPEWNKNGLDMCFSVLNHLAGPGVDDTAAAELGALAITVIDHAGLQTLGSTAHDLLRALAIRLASATHTALIQSLSIVFARFANIDAQGTIAFLATVQTSSSSGSDQNETGLSVLLSKWLENAGIFTGFEEIHQSVQGLIAIYKCHDPRLNEIHVQGDLIPDTSTRIRTRSMTKNQPIRYTVISANLKLVKVLVQELLVIDPKADRINLGRGKDAWRNGNDSDDDWESDSDDEAQYFKGLENNKIRSDDETQRLLVNFMVAEGGEPTFQSLYSQLTEAEKVKAQNAVEQWRLMEAQTSSLSSNY